MNDILFRKFNIFQNPENKPLEDLKLEIQINGIIKRIPALDKYWVEKKYFLNYETPNLIDSNGKDIIGAKEQWFELTSFILNDLIWLRYLPFYKFWSNIIFNPCIMNSIITFLQEAPNFYTLEYFYNTYHLREHFNMIRKNILIVFTRLVTNKESPTEYINLQEHAQLLYNKYIFTVPILMELCQQYGRDNRRIVEKIVNSVFVLQPFYKADLEKAIIFIIQALTKIEKRFEDCPTNQKGKPILLSERGGANVEITFPNLEYLILYLLDTVSTISIFLDIYDACVDSFKVEDFPAKIISIYSNTIPEIYKRLNDLASVDETVQKYVELKHRLDVIRIEILHIYRTIIYKQIKNIGEDFLLNLMYILSERKFIIDYHNVYPVTDDFQTLLNLYPDLDIIKCEFIVNSIFSCLDEPVFSLRCTSIERIPDMIKSNYVQSNDILETKNKTSIDKTNAKSEVELLSLISDIKDIFCNLSEGMIQKCLTYYNYNKESVINAVLEDCLPVELKSLDPTLPYLPSDSEKLAPTIDLSNEIEKLNVSENNQFDIMTKDVTDSISIHKGKRKDKYENLNELLNEKSHIAESKNIYNKYSIVTSEYDDEYDDTYNDQNVGSNIQDDIVEVDARPFITPRVFSTFKKRNYSEGVEENFEFKTD
ncbi:PREDICTED: activating signal cointegrator 1 complex subunit 2, partial [Ceratosolen solmsi marchali]|uniref:Activating signal cointegrator 1 complex subunit 2 n=1 Tax=Ceratosolen solmsi marchali TaxID=326594 RepID=A0AAJ6YSF6_9HYME